MGFRGGRPGAFVAIALLVTGCTAQIIPERMSALQGKPISIAIAKLGLPTDERTIAGQKIYIWSTSNFVRGTSYGCMIRAAVNANGIITTTDGEGNEGGCSAFAEMLSR